MGLAEPPGAVLALAGAVGTETRALLEAILTDESVSSPLVEQFGVRTMHSRAQLVSLFYYMGMLTFGEGSEASADPLLVIPNRVIRALQWEHLALALKDQESIWIDTEALSKALASMAIQGDIEPLLALFRGEVVARIGTKDLRQFNEKVLKLMLLAYISQSRMFKILAKATEVERALDEAFTQLDRYASDQALVPLLTLGKELRAGVLLVVGTKKLIFQRWPRAARPAKRAAKRAARKPRPKGTRRAR